MDIKFHFPTGLRKGGGGPDSFVVKDYKKGPFFVPFPNLDLGFIHVKLICLNQGFFQRFHNDDEGMENTLYCS